MVIVQKIKDIKFDYYFLAKNNKKNRQYPCPNIERGVVMDVIVKKLPKIICILVYYRFYLMVTLTIRSAE